MNSFEFENDTNENFGYAPPMWFDWRVGCITSQFEQMSPIEFSSIIGVTFFIHYLLLKLTGKRDENTHKWMNKKRFLFEFKMCVFVYMSEMNI